MINNREYYYKELSRTRHGHENFTPKFTIETNKPKSMCVVTWYRRHAKDKTRSERGEKEGI